LIVSKDSEPKKVIPLLTCSVRTIESKEGQEDRYCFQVLTNDDNYSFYGESSTEVNEWVSAIKEACEAMMKSSLGEHKSGTAMGPEKEAVIQLLLLKENQECADCESKCKNTTYLFIR
jgi:hypothetical protein